MVDGHAGINDFTILFFFQHFHYLILGMVNKGLTLRMGTREITGLTVSSQEKVPVIIAAHPSARKKSALPGAINSSRALLRRESCRANVLVTQLPNRSIMKACCG